MTKKTHNNKSGPGGLPGIGELLSPDALQRLANFALMLASIHDHLTSKEYTSASDGKIGPSDDNNKTCTQYEKIT